MQELSSSSLPEELEVGLYVDASHARNLVMAPRSQGVAAIGTAP